MDGMAFQYRWTTQRGLRSLAPLGGAEKDGGVGEGPVGGLESDLEVADHQDARLQEDPHPLQPGAGPWVHTLGR